MSFVEKAVIMNAGEMSRALKRMAHEIIEANKGTEDLVLLGVQRRGVPAGRHAADAIRQVEGIEVPRARSTSRSTGTTSPPRAVAARGVRPRCRST
jgi:pyrimidine operon attenuation protein/uracil phosphoribosyltransferase